MTWTHESRSDTMHILAAWFQSRFSLNRFSVTESLKASLIFFISQQQGQSMWYDQLHKHRIDQASCSLFVNAIFIGFHKFMHKTILDRFFPSTEIFSSLWSFHILCSLIITKKAIWSIKSMSSLRPIPWPHLFPWKLFSLTWIPLWFFHQQLSQPVFRVEN